LTIYRPDLENAISGEEFSALKEEKLRSKEKNKK